MNQNLCELNIKFRMKLRLEKNQKVIKNDNDQLVVKNYPQNKQPIIQQLKFRPPNCPSCKQNTWLEFDKRYYCRNCEYSVNKQNFSNSRRNNIEVEKFEISDKSFQVKLTI